VFETLPIDEAIDYVESIWTDDLFEAYNANDTTEYRDTLKCDLLCIARNNNCNLSIDDMFDYFVGRIGADPLNDFVQLIAYLATGTWVGTQINDMFFAGQLIMLKLGNQYFNAIGTKTYRGYMGIGARSPNDTWDIICDECEILPFVVLANTYETIDNSPTFIENTPTGGSIWECTYVFVEGQWAIAVSTLVAEIVTLTVLLSASPCDHYQHFDGTDYVTGSGDGASPPNWSLLGFYGTEAGTCIIEVERTG